MVLAHAEADNIGGAMHHARLSEDRRGAPISVQTGLYGIA